MYGVFYALFRGPNSHNSVWKDTDQLKIVFYRLTPRSKAYSLTFLYDEFMMYKGLYNFQLYSLHKQSILMYLGENLIQGYSQETVAGDYLSESEVSAQQRDSVSTSITVDTLQGDPTLVSNQFPGYTTLPSNELDTEQDRMGGQDILEAIKRELQQLRVNSARQKLETEV